MPGNSTSTRSLVWSSKRLSDSVPHACSHDSCMSCTHLIPINPKHSRHRFVIRAFVMNLRPICSRATVNLPTCWSRLSSIACIVFISLHSNFVPVVSLIFAVDARALILICCALVATSQPVVDVTEGCFCSSASSLTTQHRHHKHSLVVTYPSLYSVHIH